jgi:hypothetical protein
VTTQTEIGQRNHRRAVRFFWTFLIGATAISLVGNVAHAVLPYIPPMIVQIGAAAVPPVVLLAAVHGIALAVRAGASSSIYRWAVGAVAAIGIGAFAVSFLALSDLMRAIGYSPTIAWVFPAIIDTTVAVSTLMLVALGDKPVSRVRTTKTSFTSHARAQNRSAQGAKSQLTMSAPAQAAHNISVPFSASTGPESVQTVQAPVAQADADLASELIASGVTTQAVDTVVAVLVACRRGASINAAAKASGINFRTAQRIIEAADGRQHRDLAAVG